MSESAFESKIVNIIDRNRASPHTNRDETIKQPVDLTPISLRQAREQRKAFEHVEIDYDAFIDGSGKQRYPLRPTLRSVR